jgi:CheY-like chemotaxis protein
MRVTNLHDRLSVSTAEAHLYEERELALGVSTLGLASLDTALLAHEVALRIGNVPPVLLAVLRKEMGRLERAACVLRAHAHLKQIEQGRLHLRERPVDTAATAELVISRLALRGRERGTRLEVDGAPRWGYSDPVMLEDVVALVVESLLADASGGTLTIRSHDDGPACTVAIARHGGIERDGDGRGHERCSAVSWLLARRIAHSLGHRIDRTRIDHMDRVRLSMARAPAPDLLPSLPGAVPDLTGRHVLVVDDDGAVRLSLRLLLESEGMHARAVATRAEALTDFAADPPEIVIVDRHLGVDGSGGALVGEMRVASSRAFGAVLVSGDPEIAMTRVDDSADVLLSKPFTADDLLDALRRAVTARAAAACESIPERSGLAAS